MGHEYIKENDTFSTSRNGIVPKPSASDVSNNKVLQADGSWVSQSGGGGGSSTLAGLTDVDLTNPSDGQILKYDAQSQKWVNGAGGGSSGHNYSTTEQVVGTWIDGKPIYEKTVDCGYLSNNMSVTSPHGISNLKRVISHEGSAINSSGTYLPIPKVSPVGLQYAVDITVTATDIVISTGADRTDYYAYVTLRYTKTTD